MKQNAEKWYAQAKKDLQAALKSFHVKEYAWACFQAHQAIEKALKAAYIRKHDALLKTHDLVLLAKRLEAPESILISCSKINPVYLDTRYPDIPKEYTEETAQKIFKDAGEVLAWTEKN